MANTYSLAQSHLTRTRTLPRHFVGTLRKLCCRSHPRDWPFGTICMRMGYVRFGTCIWHCLMSTCASGLRYIHTPIYGVMWRGPTHSLTHRCTRKDDEDRKMGDALFGCASIISIVFDDFTPYCSLNSSPVLCNACTNSRSCIKYL